MTTLLDEIKNHTIRNGLTFLQRAEKKLINTTFIFFFEELAKNPTMTEKEQTEFKKEILKNHNEFMDELKEMEDEIND